MSVLDVGFTLIVIGLVIMLWGVRPRSGEQYITEADVQPIKDETSAIPIVVDPRKANHP